MANTSVFIPVITPVVTGAGLSGVGTVGDPLINSAVPTIASTQVAYATGANTIGGDAGLTYVAANNTLVFTTAADDSIRFYNTAYSATAFAHIEIGTDGSFQLLGPVAGLTLATDGVIYGDKFNGSLYETYGDGVVRPDTTTAHTLTLQAYDVNGTTYRTFLTLTNGDVPSCTISQPSGGLLVLSPPTADPHVSGALWNNSGVVALSTG